MYRGLALAAERTAKACAGVTCVAACQAVAHTQTYVPLPELGAAEVGRELPRLARERRRMDPFMAAQQDAQRQELQRVLDRARVRSQPIPTPTPTPTQSTQSMQSTQSTQ